MNIAETRTYQIGKFTIRQQPHFDNPAFAQYLVYFGERLVGKQFSAPSESDCEWLSRQTDIECPRYADRRSRGRRYSTGGYTTRNAEKPQTEPVS